MATLSSLDRHPLSPLPSRALLPPPPVENHGENEGEELEICLAIPRGRMHERRFAPFTGLPGWTPIEFFPRDGNRG